VIGYTYEEIKNDKKRKNVLLRSARRNQVWQLANWLSLDQLARLTVKQDLLEKG
jgi:hypothetical protein